MITDITDSFCYERLDGEYAAIWAAEIVHAVGQMNSLLPPSFEPFKQVEDICPYCGTNK